MIAAPKILLVDDDEDDSVLVRDLILEAFEKGPPSDWVNTYEGGLSAMVAGNHDVYLVDFRLGSRNGLDLVREAVRQGCKAPIILLTGQDSRKTDIDAMAAGAVDYLVKGTITASQLERSIRYSIGRKLVEERLERLGFEDGLTGLQTRAPFQQHLEQTVRLARREHRTFAVTMIDLDGFKSINDTHGHAAGDLVLAEIAKRVKSVLRASDVIARIGGDEFAAVLPTTGTVEGAAVVARKLVDIATRPVALEHGEVKVGLSVGMAIFPVDGAAPDAVLKRADEAMYQAKRTGGGYAIAGDGDCAKTIDGAILVGRLVEAIEQDELDMYHQPKIDLRTGQVSGVEALVRWHHPERGCLSPAAFVEAAEKTFAIEPMTIATLSKALKHAESFRDAGHDLSLAVNLSAQAFRNDALPDLIAQALSGSSLPPEKLTLEISESGLIADFDRLVAMLAWIARSGVSISIDDFGAGLSIFARLKDLPVNELKIHGSLIRDLAADDPDPAIVRSILSLCKDFGLVSVAEAVETEAARDRLTEMGCQMAQGFYFAHPMPAEEVGAWIDSWPLPNSADRKAKG